MSGASSKVPAPMTHCPRIRISRRMGSTAPINGNSASSAQPLAQPIEDLMVCFRPRPQSRCPIQSATSMTNMPANHAQTKGGTVPVTRKSSRIAGPR